MDLEAYRLKNNLSYTQLAELINVKQAKQARSYALGHSWPRSNQLQTIIKSAKGVTLEAMHKRRLDFLPSRNERSAA